MKSTWRTSCSLAEGGRARVAATSDNSARWPPWTVHPANSVWSLPGPKPAEKGRQAPARLRGYAKRHRKKLYCGKREGRVTTAGEPAPFQVRNGLPDLLHIGRRPAADLKVHGQHPALTKAPAPASAASPIPAVAPAPVPAPATTTTSTTTTTTTSLRGRSRTRTRSAFSVTRPAPFVWVGGLVFCRIQCPPARLLCLERCMLLGELRVHPLSRISHTLALCSFVAHAINSCGHGALLSSITCSSIV
jgi:hypothetical protein